MVMMPHNKIFAVLTISAFFVFGCYYDYDYEYISLVDSMDILEYGKTELRNVREHDDMPIKYKLERDRYILFASVDKKSIPPAVIFTLESKSLIDANIEGTTIRCFGFFHDIRPSEVRNSGYPEGGIRFSWQPTSYGPCEKEVMPVGENRKVVVSVYDKVSGLVAKEELRFDILSNGIYRESDSI